MADPTRRAGIRGRTPPPSRDSPITTAGRRSGKRISGLETDGGDIGKSIRALGANLRELGHHTAARAVIADCVQALSPDVSTREACALVGLSRATKHRLDHPFIGPRTAPTRSSDPAALSPAERQQIITVLTSPEFVDKAPHQVFYTLLERGRYLASPRTLYRVLAADGLVRERRSHTRHPPRAIPHLHATGPCQVASWDITALIGPHRGLYFYGYVMIDIFSRFMPAARSYPAQREDYTLQFIDAAIAGFDGVIPDVIHSDNGGPMIAGTVNDLYTKLGITRSLSRPRTSNDNPYSEAGFKTIKHCPAYPGHFPTIHDSQVFLDDFRDYYNNRHYHSGLNYYTPASVHNGTWPTIQAKRQQTLDAAHAAHSHRFTKAPTAAALPTQAWINQPRAMITTTPPGGQTQKI